jgi:hypothetical protein
MTRKVKGRLGIGLAVVAAMAAGGGAYAATRSGGDSGQAFLNDVAKRLHVTPQQLKSALQGAALDRLNAAVAAGRITQAEANAIKQKIEHGLPPLGIFHRGFRGGPEAFGVFPGPLGIAGPGPLAAAASYLGLSEPQLFKQLASGKSLAQIASAQKKSVSGLKAAMTKAIKSSLDKAVASKQITSAEEQQILNALVARLDWKISRAGFGPRFGPPPGLHGIGFPPLAMRVTPAPPLPAPPGV